MKELLQAIANSSIEQQVSLLPQALNYGESGIDFLINSLNDPELEVRAKAYELLQHNQSQKVQQAIAPGLLFNPGDKIFHIRKSAMWFNDHCYSLEQPSNIEQERHLVTYNDYINQSFKIIRFDRAAYIITLAPYFINYQQAKLSAESVHNKRISELSITEFDLKDDRETIKQWCDRYQITQAVSDFQKEKDLKKGLDRWREIHGISDLKDSIYWSTVESYLKSSEHLDLLNQLWQDLVGKFTFVGEIIFDKTTYLSIDPYYSQILGYKDTYKYSYGQDVEELSLSLEETETNYLLTVLNSSQLEIRILAYQLLQGIDREKAKQTSHQVLAVSLHPPLKSYCSQKELEVAMIKMQKALQVPVYLEMMPSDKYWCSSIQTLVDFPLLLDVSHVNIWYQGNTTTTKETCLTLLNSYAVGEIHLSHNAGKADTHDLIPNNIWFNDYLAEWNDHYLVTYESLTIDYAAYERLDKGGKFDSPF